MEQNVESDTTGVERRQSNERLVGCSSCPSAKEKRS